MSDTPSLQQPSGRKTWLFIALCRVETEVFLGPHSIVPAIKVHHGYRSMKRSDDELKLFLLGRNGHHIPLHDLGLKFRLRQDTAPAPTSDTRWAGTLWTVDKYHFRSGQDPAQRPASAPRCAAAERRLRMSHEPNNLSFNRPSKFTLCLLKRGEWCHIVTQRCTAYKLTHKSNQKYST